VLGANPTKKQITDLGQLKTSLSTIYLSLPAGKLALFNRLMRLFVNSLLEAVEREKTKPQWPVVVVLDEFAVLGYMRQLEVAAGYIRGFHVKLWVILQNLGQLKALYRESWETFLGNNVLHFFGNSDLTTLEYIEKRCGKTAVEVVQKSHSTQSAVANHSVSVQMQPLITATEAARLFASVDPLKRQLVVWPGFDGIIVQATRFFDRDAPYFNKYFKAYWEFMA